MTKPELTLTDLAGAPGDPVLLLGPSLGTGVRRLWGEVVAQLPGFRVFGWDLPGHGSSPAAQEAFTMADLAAAVLAGIDRAAGARPSPYLYAGDSIGGAVGLQLLLDARDRFDAAAICCSAARFGTPQGWHERAALVRSEGMAPLVASGPQRWFGTAVTAAPTADSRAVVQEQAAVDPESYALACEALAAFDLTDRLGEISAPLLVVAGSDDIATPPDQLRVIAHAVARGTFTQLPGVGHLAPLEDPAGTARALQQHYARASA